MASVSDGNDFNLVELLLFFLHIRHDTNKNVQITIMNPTAPRTRYSVGN